MAAVTQPNQGESSGGARGGVSVGACGGKTETIVGRIYAGVVWVSAAEVEWRASYRPPLCAEAGVTVEEPHRLSSTRPSPLSTRRRGLGFLSATGRRHKWNSRVAPQSESFAIALLVCCQISEEVEGPRAELQEVAFAGDVASGGWRRRPGKKEEEVLGSIHHWSRMGAAHGAL